MPVIGYLSLGPEQLAVPGGPAAALRAAFVRGLNEAGYFEGQNITILSKGADYHHDRLPAVAADLVDKRVSVIFATAPTDVPKAAQAATDKIPIVFVTTSDPVAVGLVASLRRPGGNITGVAFLTELLNAKRLELLREAVPSARTIAYLFNPTTFDDGRSGRVKAAALSLGVGLSIVNATTRSEIEDAFAEIVGERVEALLVDSEPLFYEQRDLVIALAARHAVPTICPNQEYVADGGLMAYGPIVPDAFRIAGRYVGRILKGEKPGDLPVEQSTRIEFAINLKTAKALGLNIPLPLLARADEVIE
jgi:putative tryptophan/tyrosine transport system substrate-binding protein